MLIDVAFAIIKHKTKLADPAGLPAEQFIYVKQNHTFHNISNPTFQHFGPLKVDFYKYILNQLFSMSLSDFIKIGSSV